MHINLRLSRRTKRVIRWLRKHYPSRKKVRVRVSPNDDRCDWYGLCVYDDTTALIKLRHETPPDTEIETLIEEWTHVLRTECPVPIEDDHDALFWAIYATIIKKFRGE